MSEKLFNDNWKFMLKEVGSELSDAVAESDWHDVEVPHDWLIGDTHNLYKSGDGWYRKTFDIGKKGEDEAFILRFDGVYMDSTVYVNGEKAGGREYGYSCFSVDITDKLHDGENEIYVRVRYQSPNTRWYSGAGIFRNVFLRRTNVCHINENGVYISARKYDEGNKWIVIIETESSGGNCDIRHRVFDSRGRRCAEVTSKQFEGFSRSAFYAVNPEVWDIDAPVSYKMVSELFDANGDVIDSVTNVFGFRTTEFDPDRGFLLNGRQLKLKGVCMHHDLGALGAAMNRYALRRQLKILKSYGVNAVRTSHNMPARELIDLCTEMGLMVDSECFDMWECSKTEYDYARFFKEKYEQEVESWITRDRNAPCVIMWSIGNEIYDTHKDEHGLEIAENLVRAVNKFDKYSNAVCTIGSNYMRWANAQKVADFLKIAGYNYAEDLYDGHHEAYPDWFIYGSETASTVRSRGIYHFPADSDILTHDDMQCSDYGNSVVGWGKASEKALIDDRDREYCGGQFVWTGFDYIGEPTPYSTKNSYFGIVDTAGFPKDSYYLYKAVWGGKEDPFVHIFPYWDFNIGEEIAVRTYSNMPDVELKYNGKSLGVQHVDFEHGDRFYCEWKLRYRKGTITATAFDENGKEAAMDSVSSFGDPESIDASPDKYIMNADGRDLIFIEISVADKNGITVANARNRIKVSVEGAARLVGLDNGDSTDYDSYKGDNKRLFGGKLLAIIQSTLEPGEVTVSLKSEGLWGKELTFTSLECEKPEGISLADEYYPKVVTEYKNEIPLRKIELYATRTILSPEVSAAGVTARLLPENADYTDIEFSCILPNGTPVGLSEIESTEYGAKIIGKADGDYVIRASCRNGTDIPQIYSELHMTNNGFGALSTDAYSFISVALTKFSNIPFNLVERNAVSTKNERMVFGFENIDFGTCGSEKIKLYCGLNEGGTVPVELWTGDPDNGGKFIATLDFESNGLWDNFAAQEFTLPERICGLNTIAFVIEHHIIFGGFEFVQVNRAFDRLRPTDNDEIYGDDYNIAGVRVKEIGNNVIISFKALDFGEGTNCITICGRTPNEVNSIQLRYTGEDGVQNTQLLEFAQAYDYNEQTFALEPITGKNDISFVFMPGSKFDFDWFMFGKNE